MPANLVQEGLRCRTVAAGHSCCIEIADGRNLGPVEHRSSADLGSHLTKAVRRTDRLADSDARPSAAAEHRRSRSHLAAGPGMRECYAVGAGSGLVVRGMGTARTLSAAVEVDMKASVVRTVHGKRSYRMEHSAGLKMRVVDVDCAVGQSSRRKLDLSDHTMVLERKAHIARNHDGSGQHCLQWGCSLQWYYADRTIVGLVADKLLGEPRRNSHYCAGRSTSSRSYCSNSVGLSQSIATTRTSLTLEP